MRFYEIKRFFVLMVLWLILSGYFNVFFIVSGMCSAVLSLVIVNILLERIHYNNGERVIHISSECSFTFFIRSLYYIVWLVKQIVVSNICIVKKIWKLKLDTDSCVFKLITVQQKNDLGVLVLANSITLTPGTVSVDVIKEDRYKIKVLAIDKELISGVDDIDNKVKEIFQ